MENFTNQMDEMTIATQLVNEEMDKNNKIDAN